MTPTEKHRIKPHLVSFFDSALSVGVNSFAMSALSFKYVNHKKEETLMEEIMSSQQNIVTKEVREGDKVLTVTAVEEEENMWKLEIHGKAGQGTTWTEFFSTAEEAINEADAAISDEGFAGFYANPEFAYLD